MNWNALKESIDIDQLEESLSISVVKNNGNEDIARCPLPSHMGEDRNPSFSINRDKKLFNCFACGVGGTLLTLVMQVKNCSYEDAYNYCRRFSNGQSQSGAELLERINRIIAKPEEKSEKVLPVFKSDIIDKWNNETDYYKNRGISEEVCSLLRLRYNPEHQRGEYIGPAAIIPHFWNKKLVGYQERWIGDTPKSIPKYTNTKDFPRAETLYNYDNVVVGDVIVVESALTAAYLMSNGYQSVATFGASVQKEQIKLIRNLCSVGCNVYISFDNDAAGDAATERIISQLKHSIPLFVIPKPDGAKGDLNDLTPEAVADRIASARPWWASKRT